MSPIYVRYVVDHNFSKFIFYNTVILFQIYFLLSLAFINSSSFVPQRKHLLLMTHSPGARPTATRTQNDRYKYIELSIGKL